MSDDLELYLLPPLAFARVGSADETSPNFYHGQRNQDTYSHIPLHPSDRYEVHPINGTLINNQTNQISPDSFVTESESDSEGKIKEVKPVAPFFEVWKKTDEDNLERFVWDDLKYLTKNEYTYHWEIEVVNKKIYRRTNDCKDIFELVINDKFNQCTDKNNQDKHPFLTIDGDSTNKHIPKPLIASCFNLKPKTIPFGSVQFINGADNDVVMLRFTPANGLVYGNCDGYELMGNWKGHFDGKDDSTSPSYIYAADSKYKSKGYYDDICDGFVRFVIKDKKDNIIETAAARIITTPPDYSLDTLPVRSIDDELEQLVHGIDVFKQFEDSPEGRQRILLKLIDILERSTDVIGNFSYKRLVSRLLDRARRRKELNLEKNIIKAFLNGDSDSLKKEDLTFKNDYLMSIHSGLLKRLKIILKTPVKSNKSANTIESLGNILRTFNQVSSEDKFELIKMPALMRGSDSFRLALTRRQYNLFQHAVTLFQISEASFNIYRENSPNRVIEFIKNNVIRYEYLDSGQILNRLESLEGVDQLVFSQNVELGIQLNEQIQNKGLILSEDQIQDPVPHPDIKKVPTNDVMALFRYQSIYNPPTVLPLYAVSNCFPGLEIDFRAIWSNIFKGKKLHESQPYFLKFRKIEKRFNKISNINNTGAPFDVTNDNNLLEYFNSLAEVLTPVDLKKNSVYIYESEKEKPEKVKVEEFFDQENAALINQAIAAAGELTQGLCSPWQNDFKACACDYWAASRPDFIEIENGKEDIWLENELKDPGKDEEDFEDLFVNWETRLRFVIKGKTT